MYPIHKKILVINGPNLNMLGKRDPKHYGSDTLPGIISALIELGKNEDLNCEIDDRQSNHEGVIIDWIQHSIDEHSDGIIINAGGYTHTSIAIRDALQIAYYLGVPAIEVHLSDIHKREPFRHVSFLMEVCIAQISGLGKESYLEGLRKLAKHIEDKKNRTYEAST